MSRPRCRPTASTRCARTPPTRPCGSSRRGSPAAAAPDRRDRVELIGIGYHWPNLGLAQGFDHVFGHNPLRLRWFQEATHAGDTVALPSQRQFSPLYPSYRSAFADLLGVRFIATGVPVEQIDTSLKPGDLNFIARTKDAYVYENPRALPRVMLLTDWRLADFDDLLRNGWPDVDPRRTVLLKKRAGRVPGRRGRRGRQRPPAALRQHRGRGRGRGAGGRDRTRLQNGDIGFTFETDTKITNKVEVPAEFQVSIPIYNGEQPDILRAKFRYRATGEGLLLGFQWHRVEYQRRAYFNQIATAVCEDTGLTAVFGRAV